MNHDDINAKIQTFLKELGVPSFIVFGWQHGEGEPEEGKAQFSVVSSHHKVPPSAVIKGLSWALNDIIGKTLK